MVANNNNSNVIPFTGRQGVSNRDMVDITTQQQTFFSMDLNPENPIQWESRKVHPLIKILFLSKSIPDIPISRKTETFCRSLDDTGSQNFGHSKSMQNSISFKIFSVKNPFPTKIESRRGRIGETGGKRNVEEGSHQKISTIKRGVFKQLIPCKKEGWGPKISDKFETTEFIYCLNSYIIDILFIYLILSLQNGRFAKSEIHVAKRRLLTCTCPNLT